MRIGWRVLGDAAWNIGLWLVLPIAAFKIASNFIPWPWGDRIAGGIIVTLVICIWAQINGSWLRRRRG